MSKPTWLQGKALGEWVSVSGTAMTDYDHSIIDAAGLNPSDHHFGKWWYGIFANSGGCFKGGGTILIFGGGGAGGWAGNEVRALDLTQDRPAWTTLINPSASTAVWPLGPPSHAYNQEGKPNARHSYRQPQFINADNEFWAFGCTNVWEIDSGNFHVVDRYSFANAAWDAAGTWPDMPHTRFWDGNLTVKHPITEDVYVCLGPYVSKWSRTAHEWSTVVNTALSGLDKGCGAIDPNSGSGGILLRIGAAQSGHVCQKIDCISGSVTAGDLTGPHASQLAQTNDYGPAFGICYDLKLKKFLAYNCRQAIFTVTPSGSDWYVDVFPTNGTPPIYDATMNPGGVLGRFGYCPDLNGVAFMTPGPGAGTQHTFFVLTYDSTHLRPISNVSSGTWTPAGAASLYEAIDEVTPDADDYASTTVPSTFKVALQSGVTDPQSSIGHVIRFRARSASKEDFKMSLYEGDSKLIAEWTVTLTADMQGYEYTLAGAEADSISDYNNLRLWGEAL